MFAAVLEFKMPYSRYSLHAFMQFGCLNTMSLAHADTDN